MPSRTGLTPPPLNPIQQTNQVLRRRSHQVPRTPPNTNKQRLTRHTVVPLRQKDLRIDPQLAVMSNPKHQKFSTTLGIFRRTSSVDDSPTRQIITAVLT